jgi:regulation of enolase protein 1 (concanavalin A-like superfamily)
MNRLLIVSLLTFLASALVVAAPVPKEKDPNKLIEHLFGKPFLPDGKYEIALGGEGLQIRVPAGTNTWGNARNGFNIPRVSKEISGDFVASVKIKLLKADSENEAVNITTGIFIMGDESTFLEHSRTVTRGNGPERRQGILRAVQPRMSSSAGSGGGAFNPDATFHKLERRGETIAAFASADGRGGWHKLGEWKLPLQETVRVGLHVAHSGGPYMVEFSDFTVSPIR